jgi:hypothetical protein
MSWLLADITGIKDSILSGDKREWHEETCIAQKMSWAAGRKTTRAEDLAYCLMGLFDINMPLLYGEGAQKAFIRLQTEIMARTTDESIFAWRYHETDRRRHFGLLAEHPSWFTSSGDVYISIRQGGLPFERSSTHQMTSRGVRIDPSRILSKKLDEKLERGEKEGFLMPLNSYEFHNLDHYYVLALKMIKITDFFGRASPDPWRRLPDLELIKVHKGAVEALRWEDEEVIYAPQIQGTTSFSRSRERTLIRTHNLDKYGFTLICDNAWCKYYGPGMAQLIGRNTQGDLILEHSKLEKYSELASSEYGFLFGNESMKFSLIICLGVAVSCNLHWGAPFSESDKLDEFERRQWKKPEDRFWIPHESPCLLKDRCSYYLKDKLYVSASSRVGRESGNSVNIVDVSIGSQERWVNGMRAPE